MLEDIAIVGIDFVLPEITDLDELHHALSSKQDFVKKISEERIRATTLKPEEAFRKAGYIDEIDQFDHAFFGISLAEAEVMDPSQRLLLQSVKRCFDNAGYSQEAINGSNISVFVSDVNPEYYELAEEMLDTMVSGNSPAFLATKISRFFNLTGNSSVVDTACSSSLVALYNACNELLLGEREGAVVCGTNVNLFPYKNKLKEFAIWSSDDKSRAFSNEADGMSCGEGVLSIYIKRLKDAKKDKDHVYAVIKGIAVNNNAGRSASATSPDSISQARVITDAWKKAAVNPEEVEFIEAHGSGTKIGDVLEMESLTLAFDEYTNKRKFCPISTIKSNLGHGYNISGLVGIIKIIASLKYETIYPSIHSEAPNEMIDFENTAVYVSKEVEPWPANKAKRRISGVTSLGASGTNVHVVLEDYATENEIKEEKPENFIFPFSGKSLISLQKNIDVFQQFLEKKIHENFSLRQLSYMLAQGRSHYKYRKAFISSSVEDLLDQLSKFVVQEEKKQVKQIVYLPALALDQPSINQEILESIHVMDDLRTKVNYDKKNEKVSEAILQTIASLYEIEQFGIKLTNLLGLGRGRLVVEFFDKVNKVKNKTVDLTVPDSFFEDENLEDKVEKLINHPLFREESCLVLVGKHPTLENLLMKKLSSKGNVTLLKYYQLEDSREPIQQFISYLYENGAMINWLKCFNDKQEYKLPIPGYMFDKKHCWLREEPILQDTKQASQRQVSSITSFYDYLETTVLASWEQTLGFEISSTAANFFEIGGDSLTATKLIMHLNRELDIQLSFEDIFDFPTVQQQVEFIKESQSVSTILNKIWTIILKNNQISEEDNFFEIGGHSLMANQVVNSINDIFKTKISFDTIYEYPTLKLLSKYIEEEKENYQPENEMTEIEIPTIYDLSAAQERIWLLSQFEEASIAYNTPFLVEVSGEISLESLKKALVHVVDSNESLRTVFFTDSEGKPKQNIVDIDQIDSIIKYNENLTEDEIKEKISENIQKAFDLEKGPLFYMELYKKSTDSHLLFINIHHIISDGWSMHVLLEQLFSYYISFCQGMSVPQIKGDSFYYKYIEQEKQYRISSKYLADKEYWAKKFEPYQHDFELMTDNKRPKVKTFSGSTEKIHFEKNKLLKYCQKNGLSLFQLLYGVTNILLYKYTGKQDIVVGTSEAARESLDMEKEIGLFIKNLPLYSTVDSQKTVQEILSISKKNALQAFKHKSYPLSDLLQDLKIERDISKSPLFDVFIELHNTNYLTNELLDSKNMKISPVYLETATSIFDLSIEFEEHDSSLTGRFIYNTDLFNKRTIQRMKKNYENIIMQIVSEQVNETKLSELSIIVEEEKEEIKCLGTGEKMEFTELSVNSIIQERMLEKPESIAIIESTKIVTYQELIEKKTIMAAQLKQRGIGIGSKVIVTLPRSTELVAVILALWQLGAVYIPVATINKKADIFRKFQDSNAELLIFDEDSGLIERDETIQNISIQKLDKKLNVINEVNEFIPEAQDPAYILYTSGTTGKPKGAIVNYLGMMNHLLSKIKQFNLNEHTRLSQNATIDFDITIWQFIAPLLTGGSVRIYSDQEVFDIDGFALQIKKDNITILELVPSHFKEFTNSILKQNIQLDSLEYLFLTGEKVHSSITNNWYEKVEQASKLVNAYGPTEASDDITHYLIQTREKEVPIGKPIENAEIHLLDQHLNPVPLGVKGEICVSGYPVGNGYIQNESETAEKFRTLSSGVRIYRTGDIGKWSEDGQLLYYGREDREVKIRGKRINLAEVETNALSSGLISLVVAKVVEKNDSDYLVLYFTSDLPDVKKELTSYLRENYSMKALPDLVIQLSSFPTTINGKINIHALNSEGLAFERLSNEPIKPRTELEKYIYSVWEKALDERNFGIQDSFFELGGDSIKLMQIISLLNQSGLTVDINEFFEIPTIVNMTLLVKKEWEELQKKEQSFTSYQQELIQMPINRNKTTIYKFDNSEEIHQMLYSILHKFISGHPFLHQHLIFINGKWAIDKIEIENFSDFYHICGEEFLQKEALDMFLHATEEKERIQLFKFVECRLGTNRYLFVRFHELLFDDQSWTLLDQQLEKVLGFKRRRNMELTHEVEPQYVLKQLDFKNHKKVSLSIEQDVLNGLHTDIETATKIIGLLILSKLKKETSWTVITKQTNRTSAEATLDCLGQFSIPKAIEINLEEVKNLNETNIVNLKEKLLKISELKNIDESLPKIIIDYREVGCEVFDSYVGNEKIENHLSIFNEGTVTHYVFSGLLLNEEIDLPLTCQVVKEELKNVLKNTDSPLYTTSDFDNVVSSDELAEILNVLEEE